VTYLHPDGRRIEWSSRAHRKGSGRRVNYDHLVWRPDAYGSACFLVAGALAYVEVTGHLWHRPRRTIEGRLVAVNLFGCVAFGVCALAAYVLPASDRDVNLAIANLTTSIGALAFLVGALMLLPEGVAADNHASAQLEER